jgi:hypothetical protein
MKWITRERVKVDRVACPWLITHFVDPDAEFIFATRDEVLSRAAQEGAIPFDTPGAVLHHRGDECSFDAIMADYGLADPALHKMAEIVRGADVAAQRGNVPEAAGLEAIAAGFHLMNLPDHQVLTLEFPLYDALYLYCKQQAERQA